jgi:hypothetical protein
MASLNPPDSDVLRGRHEGRYDNALSLHSGKQAQGVFE